MTRRLPFRFGFVSLAVLSALIIALMISLISSVFDIPYATTNDFTNWAAVVIEVGIAAFIAGIVLLYDKNQKRKLEGILSEIQTITKNQQKIMNEQYNVIKSEKQRIEKWKSDWGKIILVNLESIYKMYDILNDWLNEYKQEPSPQLKTNIISSAQRNGSIVEFNIQQIKDYLPNIQNYFKDTTLAMNIIANFEQVLAVFQSLHAEHYWEHDLKGTFSIIDERKKILAGLIDRLKKEIPNKS